MSSIEEKIAMPFSSFSIAYGPTSGVKEDPQKPASTSASARTSQSIANDIARLAQQSGSDLTAIKEAVDAAEKERNALIHTALSSQAGLERMKGTAARRFILAYWAEDEVCMTQGVQLPVELDKEGDPLNWGILVEDHEHPFVSRHANIQAFREYFDIRKIPYHIAYYDN